MKILFVWRTIDGISGGVERMSSAMMNAMVERGHEVSFLTWDHEEARAMYPFSEKVTWYKLGIGDPKEKGSWKIRFERMLRIRDIVRNDKPDLIFNFESGIFFSMRMFLMGFNMPFVSAERNAPSRHHYSSNPKNRFKVFAILRLANRVTVQFDRYKEGYPKFLRKRMYSISNPVKKMKEAAVPEGSKGEKKILLCVSRLAYQKNIEVLINAFLQLSPEFPDWVLKVAGDGDDKVRLLEKLEQVNGGSQVELLGDIKDVRSLYLSSHLFCLPSRYEGFPNALAEALSYGLPAVGYRECCGVSDLIEDGETGLLADRNGDEGTLIKALRSVMSNDSGRREMGMLAKKSVEKYAPNQIFDQWEAFFKDSVA